MELDEKFNDSVIVSQTITEMREVCEEQIAQKDKEIALIKEQMESAQRLNKMLQGIIHGQESLIIALRSALSESAK